MIGTLLAVLATQSPTPAVALTDSAHALAARVEIHRSITTSGIDALARDVQTWSRRDTARFVAQFGPPETGNAREAGGDPAHSNAQAARPIRPPPEQSFTLDGSVLAYGQTARTGPSHHADQEAMFARGELKGVA